MKILFLTKRDYAVCKTAEAFTRQCFDEVTVFKGVPQGTEREGLMWWEGDCIFSFLSPWIVPASLLKRANYAINWHPAPLKYPGTGGYNFALYNRDEEYGCVCHTMVPQVDSGRIHNLTLFPVLPNDTVASLLQRTHIHLLNMYISALENITLKGMVNFDNNFYSNMRVTWERKPYTRADFEKLCELTLDMSEDEIECRIRATTFPPYPGPFITINGKRYFLRSYHESTENKM